MTSLKLNPEYARRHLFVTLLMVGLGGWFGYDGFVSYPARPAAELYRTIEGREAPEGTDLEAFKRQKIGTQYGFAILTLLAACVVGSRLARSARFKLEFDEEGYVWRGRRHRYADIRKVDRSRWEKKGIVRVDGVTLDAWHHLGVRELVAKMEGVLSK